MYTRSVYLFDRLNVSKRKVYNVDIVTHAGTVVCIIVIAKDAKTRKLTESDL